MMTIQKTGRRRMAKKKLPADDAKNWVGNPHAMHIRGTKDWKDWAVELAEFDRSGSVADLVDRALAAYARAVGFPKPPPPRT